METHREREGNDSSPLNVFLWMSLWVIKVEISLPFKQYLLCTCLVPGTGLSGGAAVKKKTCPQPHGAPVCQENITGNDNAHRGLPSAVRKRQDEIGHKLGRAGRWPLPQLNLLKGTGDTKAEEHHTEVLDRPTVEMEEGTAGRKAPGKWGSWRDRDRYVGEGAWGQVQCVGGQ